MNYRDMTLEELVWTCSCGTPMVTEINSFPVSLKIELNCSKCQYASFVEIRQSEEQSIKEEEDSIYIDELDA